MRMGVKTAAAAALSLAMIASGAAQAAELVTNGGFETGDFTGWTTDISFSLDGVDLYESNTGTFAAFFGNTAVSTISQSLATVSGQSYTISFALRVDDDVFGNVGPSSFAVSFGGTTLYSFVNAPASDYQTLTFTQVATSNATTLSFAGMDTPAYIDLDDVSVTEATASGAVPEPASWALMMLGFGMAGGLLRQRRQAPTVRA